MSERHMVTDKRYFHLIQTNWHVSVLANLDVFTLVLWIEYLRTTLVFIR